MSRRMHDIVKKLKRETGASLSAKAGSNDTAEAQNIKTRTASPQWLLIQALHQGHYEAVDRIVGQPGLMETEKLLLNGIRACWKEEASAAEQLLNKAASQSIGINKCWAHISLATLFLETGNDDAVDYHISRARRYAFEDRQDRQCLNSMVELLDARADIERGAHERAARTLQSLITDCTDPYLTGVVFYLLGCLGRFPERVGESDRIEYLERADEIFRTQETDRYYQGLIAYELAHCPSRKDKNWPSANTAAQILKSLGRMREARAAEMFVQELQHQAASSPAATQVVLNSYDRVGKCLFISASMRALRLKLDAVAAAENDPVLILGPRGSGKEMLAQSIHLLSPRKNGPMLAINCGALPDQLIESELFGYEKGAFTGANNQKPGLFEQANGGTLFLDEIGELTASAQAKLLRVLQLGKYRRLGGTAELTTTARILGATNRDLDEMAGEGKFRDDLLDRLTVWRLRIPPLNKRREEIMPLAMEFLYRYADDSFQLDESARHYLLEKDYPGNVRILENDIRRSIGIARAAGSKVITAAMIYDESEEDSDSEGDDSSERKSATLANTDHTPRGQRLAYSEIPNFEEAMLDFERDLLIRALIACQWNKKLTATALGMSERTFWRAIKRHNLHTRPDES